mmetsp:Transcript_27224/g.50199  ORF Transcript_27224/g.50199 Transcript_27224/m.50199 type:complete len:203 (+) Transcript_27224:183-791(+)
MVDVEEAMDEDGIDEDFAVTAVLLLAGGAVVVDWVVGTAIAVPARTGFGAKAILGLTSVDTVAGRFAVEVFAADERGWNWLCCCCCCCCCCRCCCWCAGKDCLVESITLSPFLSLSECAKAFLRSAVCDCRRILLRPFPETRPEDEEDERNGIPDADEFREFRAGFMTPGVVVVTAAAAPAAATTPAAATDSVDEEKVEGVV